MCCRLASKMWWGSREAVGARGAASGGGPITIPIIKGLKLIETYHETYNIETPCPYSFLPFPLSFLRVSV